MIALLRSFKHPIFMLRLTIIGFGNQARSWAQNLKDSGARVRVALRIGSPTASLAQSMGFEPVEVGSAEFYEDTTFALLTPDDSHGEFLKQFAHGFKKGSVMLYAHGFSCLEGDFTRTYPDLQHVLFAPKAIGTELRRQFLIQGKLGAVYSLEYVKDENHVIEEFIKDLARSLGVNLGPYPTTFQRETQADLYSEQGLLCSLIPYTASEMFNHLVESGVEPELAYFECWHELKLIVNAMVEMGPLAFYDLISPNALIGAEKGREKLITPEFKENLEGLLKDIQSGQFQKELREGPTVDEIRQRTRQRWTEAPLTKTFQNINRSNE